MKDIKRMLIKVSVCLILGSSLFSCKKFVDIDGPKGEQGLAGTFENDGAATAAVMGLYVNEEANIAFAVGCTGLAADELATEDPTLAEFQHNSITIPNFYNGSYLWASCYYQVRRCNLAIEGLRASTGITEQVKNQLLGEVLFFRGWSFFNLMNIYGDVPLTLSAIENENAGLGRSKVAEVWKQIFADLQEAQSLLLPDYPSPQRARVNRYAVLALLSRAYLYHRDWALAEAAATEVIKSDVYSLSSPGETFKNNSNETILQAYTQTGTTTVASLFVPYTPNVSPLFELTPDFDKAFETNRAGVPDLRKTNWTGKNEMDVPFVNKYKIPGGSGDEYTILLRLGEVYLIRAEARAMQNNLAGDNGAVADLNIVRKRAGLDNNMSTDKKAMLKAIEQERRVELFGEYMHRWFDMKRTAGFEDPSQTRADEVLSVIKGTSWQKTDKLFPIPGDQVELNKALTQNAGY